MLLHELVLVLHSIGWYCMAMTLASILNTLEGEGEPLSCCMVALYQWERLQKVHCSALYWHAACIMNLQQSAPFFFFSVFFYWHPAVPMCPTNNEALDFRILMIKGEHSKSGEDMWQCCWLLSWGHIPSITLNIGQQKGSAIYSNWSGHKREKKRRLGKSLGKRSIRGQ